MGHDHADGGAVHAHGAGVSLRPEAQAILRRGLSELLRMTEGLSFQPLVSERYPLPLVAAIYGEPPEPETVRKEIESRMDADPIDALEAALALLELYVCNLPGASRCIPDDSAFLGLAFGSKRLNGWVAATGDGDPEKFVEALNVRWKFKLIPAPERRVGVYPLLNMLARYGFVYGRIPFGDSHTMGHFVEDFTPGLVVCRGRLDALELTLSLAAMKLGAPAVVPPDYPFPLGRHVRADSLEEIEASLPVFPNIRRLLDLPEIPRLPDDLDPTHTREKFDAATTWGDTPESFYVLRRGTVSSPGDVEMIGQPAGPMGVVLTAEAEPLDAFDRRYIEARIAETLSMMRGVSARVGEGRLVLDLDEGVELAPERVGEVLIAALRHEFPKIKKVSAEVIFDRERLAGMVGTIRAEQAERLREIASTTEETIAEFTTCVGCSPFAPDHVCILTPERPPQCGRPYEMIKTGALYGYDDMTNIHHRPLHSGMNSFGACPRREAIDPVNGEWVGVNEAAWRLTGGRTRRVQLHSLEEAPHTGCGCFQLIMFKTERPRPGIGVMNRGYKGRSPDGRAWGDLHYALAGKQAPGVAGASPGYLTSPKFLAGHGGWKSVVWVSPKIAATLGERMPAGVEIGPETE